MLNGSAEFAIDSVIMYSGGKDSRFPRKSHTVEMYSQDFVFITEQPKQLLQTRNIVYPFDAGTWTFFAITLVATTLTLIIIAKKDKSLQVDIIKTQIF